ncbi:membrane protein [Streptomyces phage LilMartin]|nr:membrane protein [Streptomyces phage LilMartin]QNO12623.1 membrane protein [Streptomyces phage MulchMansion]UVK61291.1 membrane protein [Streptomyces phage Angela]
MWTIISATYLSIAGLSLIPFGLVGAMGGMLSGDSNRKIAGLVVLSAALWPASLGSWLYSTLKNR